MKSKKQNISRKDAKAQRNKGSYFPLPDALQLCVRE